MRNGRILLEGIAATIPSIAAASSQVSSAIGIALQHHIEATQSPSRGQAIHTYLLKTGFPPETTISVKLMLLYLKCNCLRYARQVFDEMPTKTVRAYSYMASGYLHRGHLDDLLDLVRGIKFADEKPYSIILSMLLKSSATINASRIAKEVHAQVLKMTCNIDHVFFASLIDSYAKNGDLGSAAGVYENLTNKNLLCSTALIDGYMNKGLVSEAEGIFEGIRDKDVVVFNAMIEGYSKKIQTAKRAQELYKDMQLFSVRPTLSTFVSVLSACSLLSAMEFGQQIHCHLVKTNALFNVHLGSAMLDMYNKCGRPEDARRLFDALPEKNVVTWTSMIDGYGKNGSSHEALKLFNDMLEDSSSVRPNYVTFLSALSACGHCGLISAARKIFESMESDYLIKPRMEHYACMVDVMGRAGCLAEALDFIKQMPSRPNSDVWAALLGASRLQGDVHLAAIAAKEVIRLSFNSSNGMPGAYIALSNSFAAAEDWESVGMVRELMKEKGVSKEIACSWIYTDKELQGFCVGDGR